MRKWGFLTNHGLVLVYITQHPNSTLREIAAAVGITERATSSIVRDLEEARIVYRRKEGRQNHYRVDLHAVMGHETRTPFTVEQLVTQIADLARQLSRPEASSDDGDPPNDDSRDPGSL